MRLETMAPPAMISTVFCQTGHLQPLPRIYTLCGLTPKHCKWQGFLFNGAATPDGSEIVMAADDFASGELRETGAFRPLLALTPLGGRELLGYANGKEPQPPASAAQRALDKSVIANGLRHCSSQGLHNMDGNFYQLELLTELHNEGQLLCRTEVQLHLLRYMLLAMQRCARLLMAIRQLLVPTAKETAAIV